MNRKTLILSLLISVLLAACAGSPEATPTQANPDDIDVPTPEGADGRAPGAAELPLLGEAAPTSVEPYAIGIIFPTRLTWTPDGGMLVAEKGGAVKLVRPGGEIQQEPVITIEVDQAGEQGLLGIATDPEYTENGHVWIYYNWSDPAVDPPETVYHRVARFTVTDEGGTLTGDDLQTAWEIEDAFTESTILNGGDVKFGPDGSLYVSVGSTNNLLASNDRNMPHGKIHRFEPTIPLTPHPENINDDSAYAYGFRNAYAMTFHPQTGVLYLTDNGPDCDDEVNQVWPGADYGWREDGLCEDQNLSDEYRPPNQRFFPPVVSYTPAVSPTGIDFYDGEIWTQWQNDTMFFCAYNFGSMFWVKLEDDGFTVERSGIIDTSPANCAVDVSTGPDGYIYFTDLSGVYRLVPQQ